MLQLYDSNEVKIRGLTQYKDYCIESVLSSGDKILSFLYPFKLSEGIKEEGYIRTKTDEFVIKEIADRGDWKAIKATLNVEDLEGQVFEHFDTTEQTIEQCLTLALAGTGWTAQVNGVTKRRVIRKTNCSTWEIIQQAKKTYLVEIQFDTINKIVKVTEKLGSDKGVYFMDSLNLRNLDIQSNSYEFYTRLIAIGKGDLKVTVENYQYSNKKKTLIWKDERYTDINALTEDATAKLAEISKPYRSYGADVIDLASTSNKYSILSYGLGDIITLISKEKGIKEKQRIVKITEYPEEPERNSCEIVNTIVTFADIQKEYQEATQTVNNITSDNGTISEGAIKVAVEQITINKADIQDLNAVNARVGNLEVTTATITQLNAERARINDLIATTATIIQLNATNAKITILEGKTANIETILAKEIFVELATIGKVVAGSSIIAEGAIGNAQISSLSAVKITSGTIDTSIVTIQGTNGRLKITGNRLQVFAGTTNLYERVSLGDVNGDGSIYGLRVRGADGVTVLLDETGVKREGITDGSINNAKIGSDANISGTKLDIASVVISINGGTTTIQGSKIFVDGKTLDLSFSTLKSTVTSQGETISSHSSSITAIDSSIKLKVDTQTYNTKMASLDGSISTINTNFSKATSDISVMQGQIALKVSQTDIDTSISKVQIGGRNLFRDSKKERISTRFIEIKVHDILAEYIGKQITISFDIKAEFSRTIQMYPYQGNGISITNYFYFVPPSEKFERFSHTTTVKDWGINNINFTLGSIAFYDGTGNNNYILKNIKIEVGNKATEWTPAPEDIDQAITTVDTKINTATSEINILKNQITLKVESTTFNNTVSTINTNVTAAETNAKSYADTKKTEAISAAATDATTKANNAKTGAVTDAKTYTDGQITTVNNTINTKVAEIKATTDNITLRVGSTETSITTINGNITSLQSRVSTAEQKITDSSIISTVTNSTAWSNQNAQIVNTQELARAMSTGKMLYNDPMFKSGNNSCTLYNNSVNGLVTITRIARPSDCPTTSTHCLEVKTTGAANPIWGGFYQSIQSRAGAKFVIKLIAKIPVGYTLNTTSNAMGTGYSNKLITPIQGTGKYEEYIVMISCGTTGTFSIGGFFYLSGGTTPTTTAPLAWQIAYCTVFDITDGDYSLVDVQRRVTTAESSIEQMAGQITSKVSVNDLSSLIRQRPNDVLIAFNNSTTSGLVDIKNGNLRLTSSSGRVGLELDYDGTIKNHWGVWSIADAPIYDGTFKLSNANDKTLLRPWGLNHAIGTGGSEQELILGTDYGVAVRTISGYQWGRSRMGGLSIMYNTERDNAQKGLFLTSNEINGYAAHSTIWLNYTTQYHTSSASTRVGNGWGSGGLGELVCGDFSASGAKNCIQETENYGWRKINAYETAEYYFGDIGRGTLVNGKCVVWIEDIFKETINTDMDYHVFLSKYGRGDIWTSERTPNYFVVEGENDIEFSWELKAKRKGYETSRLEDAEEAPVENMDFKMDESDEYVLDKPLQVSTILDEANSNVLNELDFNSSSLMEECIV